MEKLHIAGWNFTVLPPEIGELTNLKKLLLINTPVRGLPAEIGNLTELEELRIHSLPLETLPAEIGDLANLQELSLIGVPLKTLPAEIGKLSKLTKLTIRKADHQRLRTYIKQFPNLETLYFSPDPLRPTAN